MLRIYQIGSLKAWIITVQIFGIYGENEPKPTCEHAAQLTTSCPLYIQLNLQNASIKSTWMTYRHKMLVGIVEHKNIG